MVLGNSCSTPSLFLGGIAATNPSPPQGFGDQSGPVLGPILRFQALGMAHPLLPLRLLEPLLEAAAPGISRLCPSRWESSVGSWPARETGRGPSDARGARGPPAGALGPNQAYRERLLTRSPSPRPVPTCPLDSGAGEPSGLPRVLPRDPPLPPRPRVPFPPRRPHVTTGGRGRSLRE